MRLAPRPLADDGLGGMPARTVEVQWEIAADEAFTRPLQRGHTVAAPEAAHAFLPEVPQISIEVEVEQQGEPRRQYMEFNDEQPSDTAK